MMFSANKIHIAIQFIAIQAIFTPVTAVFAQSTQDSIANRTLQNVVQLSANAAIEVQQDVLTISMNTTREAADANVVQAQLKSALDAALGEAKKVAATTSSTSPTGQIEVRTGNFSLYPRYSKDGKINGWQGSAELVLQGRDFAKISSATGSIQTLTISSVAFSLSREQRQQAETQAQSQAIERFRVKAADITKSFGMNSFTLREVAINAGDQGFTPRPRIAAMSAKMSSADESLPVEAGKSTVVVTVSGSVQLK